MDRLDSMSVFIAAVEGGSLSAAGRALGMPLATVSRKVSELEAHLGTTLLRRSTRQLELTDSGRGYLLACKRIVADVEEAERTASGEYVEPKGDLIVSAPIVMGRSHVLPIVLDFLRAYRNVDVRLDLGDRAVNLLEEHVDVAVRVGELADSSLVARRVGEIRQVVCASPQYLATHGKPRRLEQLRVHDCITFGGLNSSDRWIFGHAKSRVAVAVHSRLVVNTADAAISAAVAGSGVTRVLSYQVADAIRRGELEILLGKFEPAAVPVHLVYPGGRLPLKLRAFVDYTVPKLQELLSEALQPAQLRPVRQRRDPRLTLGD